MITIDTKLVDIFIETWNETTGQNLERCNLNSGWCYQFALVIQKIYGGELMTCTAGIWHAWVEINGKQYDSDHLNGCNIEDCRLMIMSVPSKVCLKEFKAIWGRTGNSGKVRDNVINKTVERYQALKAA